MNRTDERSLKVVPPWLVIALALLLVAQLLLHRHAGSLVAEIRDLPNPPSDNTVRLASLNSPIFASHLMMLWLQSFDVQPGVSLSFKALDYSRLRNWLGHILALNPSGQYPLLSAVRIYAELPDPERQRLMLDFVAEEFEKDPARRWPWLAHAVYVAKHRLHNQAYALSLAERLAAHANIRSIPAWARQMSIFALEDMGELESAKVLLGGLLDSGQITDPHEQWFLSKRLAQLEEKLAAKSD